MRNGPSVRRQDVVPVLPDDLLGAAAVCREALAPAVGADWGRRAGELAWTCRRTLDHIPDALLLYAGMLAIRAEGRVPVVRDGDVDQPIEGLLGLVAIGAAVLAEVARAAPEGARAFHPAGRADACGFVAMGCTEILVHTADIARGLGLDFRPPDDLAGRVLARLFPWAPADGDPWAALLWAAGRGGLPGRERPGPDWYWHSAPLTEWDGTVKRRAAPPAWT
jgi:hypothetical protein